MYDAVEKFISLRYRLLPYIYSVSWDVTAHQSSMMRALMMDFAQDKQALDINDQYMFGRSLLICPVTRPMYSKDSTSEKETIKVEDFSTVKTSKVYLPKGTDWFDFWNGEKFSGGQMVSKAAPINIMPIYVKAGSLLPVGPQVQYATEKKWDSLEIRVYEGADGNFVLYEDENDNYNYEKGVYSTITFSWNDVKKVLTINDRKGSFPGMLTERKFNIVRVNANKGAGMYITEKYDKAITYSGKKVVIEF